MKQISNYILETERLSSLDDYIIEKFKISSKNVGSKYNYQPKDKDELEELIDKLIKERGLDADLNDIDTSKIIDMSDIFFNSEFNGNISKWDVSNVEDMSWTFHGADFNGDISEWDVSKVEFMDNMFEYSEFNQNIDNWNVSNETSMKDMFKGCPLEKNPPKWYK